MTDQPTLEEFKEQIRCLLLNYVEVSGSTYFEEWASIMYSPGLCGIDYCDIYITLNICTADLIRIRARNITELDALLKKELDMRLCGTVIAMKLPGRCGLETVRMVAEHVTMHMSDDATILWQAVNFTGDDIEILIMKCWVY